MRRGRSPAQVPGKQSRQQGGPPHRRGAKPAAWYRQSGVVAVRVKNGTPRVLLVTSGRGKRWVIPKGIVEEGHSPARSAAKEAWEEAGVTGRVSRRMNGRYGYEKWGGVCTVLVYRLDVEEVHREWPEGDVRRRKWFTPEKAAARVVEAPLARIILRTTEQLRARSSARAHSGPDRESGGPRNAPGSRGTSRKRRARPL